MQYRRFGRIWPLLTVILFAAAPATSSFAALYKWVDDEGRVSYSERKPLNRKVEEINLRGLSKAKPEDAQQDGEQGEQGEQVEQGGDVAGTTKSVDKEHAERFVKNCEIARKNIRVLENSKRVLGKDKDGKTYLLETAEVQSRLELSQQQVERFCK